MQGMCPEQQQHKAKAEACVKVSVGEKTKTGKSVKSSRGRGREYTAYRHEIGEKAEVLLTIIMSELNVNKQGYWSFYYASNLLTQRTETSLTL